ncbi:SDR family NAD(P)-dependent oxidoreductase, partial [Roseburia faecis]|nr:SDR family NAD(P)-dependent oxidoreductase [Roseburia faecis]
AVTFVADVGDREQVFSAVDYAHNQLGGLDIMVNNAGISQGKPLADVTQEEVERIYRINVQGTLWGIQAAAEKFLA